MNAFQDYEIPRQILSSLDRMAFHEPTETQKRVIPHSLGDKDILACAETGSGKTGAFVIPLVTKLMKDEEAKGLILAPTRELAQQISEFVRNLVRGCPNMRVVLLVGGMDIRKQMNALRKKPRIIVATPGRLTDHLNRRTVSLKSVRCLVLDEGDRMLDMGFQPQLDKILHHVSSERQSSILSATINKRVAGLANSYLRNPVKIEIGQTSRPVKAIKQSIIQLEEADKKDRILDVLNEREGSIIIFTKTQRRTSSLATYLESYGYPVSQVHGGRTQGQRNRAVAEFKSGESRILVATDVAARGLDVPQIEHVINYDLPMFTEDYVHRVGRTARNGAQGEALSFITPSDVKMWKTLVRKFEIPSVGFVEGPKRSKNSRSKKSRSKKTAKRRGRKPRRR